MFIMESLNKLIWTMKQCYKMILTIVRVLQTKHRNYYVSDNNPIQCRCHTNFEVLINEMKKENEKILDQLLENREMIDKILDITKNYSVKLKLTSELMNSKLPPPPPPLDQDALSFITISKNNIIKNSSKMSRTIIDYGRPVITVADLQKVKLKKISINKEVYKNQSINEICKFTENINFNNID
ncbi:uncharacterized protein LOC126894524 [Daktulosphaira vitifoliae]|uniref:uncharacterized protein LOC126894524 n=1 Tax=Daktulosphaira vitifoliae TaxID=58002 RepID=UPI0021AA4A67|nr:uncharacterized protein LOC126894524 [Daktulosphaira vitifoliae]